MVLQCRSMNKFFFCSNKILVTVFAVKSCHFDFALGEEKIEAKISVKERTMIFFLALILQQLRRQIRQLASLPFLQGDMRIQRMALRFIYQVG
jgi:hypothetical protein